MAKVLLLGGAGRVGQFIGKLLEQGAQRPVVIDLVAPPQPLEHRVMNALDLPVQAPELLQEASTWVFALPEDAALEALACLAKHCQARLVVNTCSVQMPFQRAMGMHLPGVASVGINPMFAPSLDCRGRPVALCEPAESSEGDALAALLGAHEMVVKRLTPTEHDQIMALCQSLPHAAILAFAMSLARSGCDMQVLDALAPPPMKTLLALAARMLHNDPRTYWDIQKYNSAAQDQRDQLMTSLERLNEVTREPAVTAFSDELEAVRQCLGAQASSYGEACANLFKVLGASGRTAACPK